MTRNEFEQYIDGEVRRANRVLAVGETNMDFRARYSDRLDECRFVRLRRLNPSIIGCDINLQNVTEARRLDLDIRHANIENSAETDKLGQFDLILMLNVIEHLSNTVTALNNLKRLLTPNGKIVIMTDSPFYFRHFVNRIIGLRMDVASDHTQFIVPENMKQLAKRCGMRLTDLNFVHNIPSQWQSRLIAETVGRVHPYFVNNFLYEVEAE